VDISRQRHPGRQRDSSGLPVTRPVIAILAGAIFLSLLAPGGNLDVRASRDIPDGEPANVAQVSAPVATSVPTAEPTVAPTPTRTAAIDEDDGAFVDEEDLSPFDDSHPALANLDPNLLAALQAAATDAEASGIPMVVTSGWRSPEYQQSLLDEAIVTYGSEDEALRWVLTPDRSSHVTGDAVDVGYTDAAYWMMENGNRYGLCQTYANEIWHYELAVEPGGTCPAPIEDANAS